MKFKKYIHVATFLSLLFNVSSMYSLIYHTDILFKNLDNNKKQTIVILSDMHENIVDARNFSGDSFFGYSKSFYLKETKTQINNIIKLAKITDAQVLVEDWYSFNEKNRFTDFIPKMLYRFYRTLLCYVKPGIKQSILLSGLHEKLLENQINSFNIENRQNIGLVQTQSIAAIALLPLLFICNKFAKIGLTLLLPTIANPLYTNTRNKQAVLKNFASNTNKKQLQQCVSDLKQEDKRKSPCNFYHIFDFLPMRNSWINDIECIAKALEQAKTINMSSDQNNAYTIMVVGGYHARRIKQQLINYFQYQEERLNEESIEKTSKDC